jgi:NIMA (never in mitosis gene a)-related kinase
MEDDVSQVRNATTGSLAERYILGRVLGTGSSGRAVLAKRRDTGDVVVVKQVKLSDLSPKERLEAINEARVLSQMDHPNIIHYHECILEVCTLGWASSLAIQVTAT